MKIKKIEGSTYLVAENDAESASIVDTLKAQEGYWELIRSVLQELEALR